MMRNPAGGDSGSVTIEVCVEGIDGLVAAEKGGADRVELCASLLEGGLTPSFATIRKAHEIAAVPFHAIVRPRGGDFLYSELEFATMLADVEMCRDIGIAGVVVGCLTPDGRIDGPRMQQLVDAARPLSVTCHRAFDMARDIEEALEALIRCGIDRVLTSGQRDTAMEGIANLRRTVELAGERIIVMGCGGLDAGNIAEVRRRAGLRELHFAALATGPSAMTFRNTRVGMGGTAIEREYQLTTTDPAEVARIIAAVRA
jgi:copper homeostasis protein